MFDVTAFIQGKVILCVAEFFWTAGDKHIIIPKEIVETGHLQREQSHSFQLQLAAFWWGSAFAGAEGGSASLLSPHPTLMVLLSTGLLLITQLPRASQDSQSH